jgi:methionyl-tRNA formyltransferase
MSTKLLFLGKSGDAMVRTAADLASSELPDVQVALFKNGDSIPDELLWWHGDYILSYLCPCVVPHRLLIRASTAAINIHPGTPEYPGIGCTNFALYENAQMFGATAHIMDVAVDSGSILSVCRVPVFASDTVSTLTDRTHAAAYLLFADILRGIVSGNLPRSHEVWTRKATTRKQLNALMQVPIGATQEEVAKITRATSFGKWSPFIEVGGVKFVREQNQ